MSVTLEFVRGALLLDWLSYLGGSFQNCQLLWAFLRNAGKEIWKCFFQCSHENTWQVDQEARHLQHVFCYSSHLCTSVHPSQDQKQAQEYIARSAAFNILSFNQTGCGSDRPHSPFYLMCSPGGGSRLIHTKIVWIWPSSFIFHKITPKKLFFASAMWQFRPNNVFPSKSNL